MTITAVTLIVISVFGPLFNANLIAQASEHHETDQITLTAEEEARVNEVAEQLEFLYEEAAIKDGNGDIVNWDIDAIEEKYGYFSEFDDLHHSNHSFRSADEDGFFDCMMGGLAGTVAGNKIEILYSKKGILVGMFKKKAWTAAAKVIVGILGAKVAVPAIVSGLTVAAGGCAFS